MRGVSKRIEAGEHVGRNRRVHVHGVAGGNAQEFSERPVAVHAHPLRILAEVAPAREAVATLAAHNMAFAVDEVTGLEALHVAAGLDDLADELVADHHRRPDGLLRPGIPIVDVHIGAADRGLLDLDEHVVDAGLRHGHLREFEAGAGPEFGDGAHGSICHEKKGSARNPNQLPRGNNLQAGRHVRRRRTRDRPGRTGYGAYSARSWAPSMASSRALVRTPPAAEKPVSRPLAPTMR